MMTQYDEVFYDYINQGSKRSADILLPKLNSILKINSLLDVGCGQGAWLSVWKKLDVERVIGIDGDYIDSERLLFPPQEFKAFDLTQPFDLAEKFDLVQSLEVAEHLPESSADDFVASLVKHGDMVLFSAAPKGQGGDHHINEQDYKYWHQKFSDHKYVLLDCIRNMIESEESVEPWYRYNTFLYVAEHRLLELPISLQNRKIELEKEIKDISPMPYKLRKILVGLLSTSMVTKLAKINEKRVANLHKNTHYK